MLFPSVRSECLMNICALLCSALTLSRTNFEGWSTRRPQMAVRSKGWISSNTCTHTHTFFSQCLNLSWGIYHCFLFRGTLIHHPFCSINHCLWRFWLRTASVEIYPKKENIFKWKWCDPNRSQTSLSSTVDSAHLTQPSSKSAQINVQMATWDWAEIRGRPSSPANSSVFMQQLLDKYVCLPAFDLSWLKETGLKLNFRVNFY